MTRGGRLDRPPGDLAALLGERELYRARVVRVPGALQQTGGLRRTRELRHVESLAAHGPRPTAHGCATALSQSGVVGEATLTGPLAGALHAVHLRHGPNDALTRALPSD
ncbi:hypothetical protein [Streptomyces caelestis]|jgi:hypothetical protein|uniref:hypothetical protein n=1 Tax=Streptomyces caelestis TaxID=36816 RepID=UPI0036F82179